MSKASGKGEDATAALQALAKARTTRERAEQAEQRAVAAARAAGASWGRIGEVYGLTKQGAQQRFKKGSAQAAPEPQTEA